MIYGANGYGAALWGGTVAAVPQVQSFADFYENDAWDIEEAAGDLFAAAWAASDGATAYSASGAITTARPSVRDTMRTTGLVLSVPFVGGGDPVAVTLGVNPLAYYTIEITDDEGAKLGTLTTWNRGTYDANVGESSRLSFTIPRSEPLLSILGFPNILVLRDRYGLVLDRFRARRSSEYNDGDGVFVDIRGRSLLDQLFREPVIDYALDGTVQEHLDLLFAGQIQTPPLALGAVDSAIAGYTVAVEAEVTNVLDIIRKIHESLPAALQGHFYVSSAMEFRWRKIIGEAGKRLTMGTNLRGIRKSIDDEDLITELHMYGEGQDGAARPYVMVQRNVATYGRIPYVKVDRRITKQETLAARAEAIIAQFCNPRITLEVDTLDLAKSDITAYRAMGDYYIGARYRVEDPAQAISEELTVIGLSYDLDNPVPVKMKSASRNQTLADVFRGLQEQIPASTDVNEGDNWPNIQRTFDGTEDTTYRDGDLSYQDDVLQYYQTQPGDWVPMAPTYIAPTEALLPEGPTYQIPENALGRTQDDGNLYKRNQANDGWEGVAAGTIWYTATTEAGLPSDVEETALGRVTAGVDIGKIYIRSYDNTVWMPIAPVKEVESLPAAPTKGMLEVYWTSAGAGDGDDQIWRVYAGQTYWTPTQKQTSLSGVP